MPGEQLFHHIRLQNQGLEDHYTFQLEAGSWPSELLTSAEIDLSSGQVFTASVMVNLPAVPGGQQLEDLFILQVDSANSPDLFLQSTGISSLGITPAISITANQSLQIGDPGEIVTHTFTLTNTGDSDDLFGLHLEGADWRTSVLPSTGIMQPGEQKSIPVHVTIPVGPLSANTIVITDTFALRVVSGWSALISDEASSSTSAGLVAGLRLEGPSMIDAFAGRLLVFYFYLTNLGNYTDRYTLDWQGEWLPEEPVAETNWIASGKWTELMTTVPIPANIQDGETHTLILKATSQLDPVRQAQISLTIQGWKRIFLPLISQSH